MTQDGNSKILRRSRATGWWFLGLGGLLVVVAMRLWMVHAWSTPLPFFDSWLLEPPWYFMVLAGELGWSQMFAAANEHRIVWTRLLSVGLFLLNDRQWDPQVQMVMNTAFAGLTAALFGLPAGRGLGIRNRHGLFIATIIVFALPIGWYNAIWGIQSLMYLLVLFSVAGILLALNASLRSPAFWGGVFCLLAALFTMGSGFIAAAVVLGISLWRMLRDRRLDRTELVRGAVGLALTLAGLALAPDRNTLEGLGAASPADFCLALLRHLAFPFSIETARTGFAWVGLLTGIPVFLLGLVYFFRKLPAERRKSLEPLLALAAWVLLQFAIMALTRGSDGRGPTWRHFDVHLLWPLINLAALFWLSRLQRAGAAPAPRWAAPLLTLAWPAVILTGLIQLSALAIREAGFRQDFIKMQEAAVRQYLIEHDPAVFKGAPGREIPALPEEIIPILDSPLGRAILPAGVREPIDLEITRNTRGAFVRGESLEAPKLAEQFIQTWASPRENTEPVTLASTPMLTQRKWLNILVAGDQPSDAENLQILLSGAESRQLKIFHPTPRQSGGWQIYRARAPDEPYRFVALDASAEQAFAFSEPIETGRLSGWVTDWRTRWPGILMVGLLMLLVGKSRVHALPHPE